MQKRDLERPVRYSFWHYFHLRVSTQVRGHHQVRRRRVASITIASPQPHKWARLLRTLKPGPETLKIAEVHAGVLTPHHLYD